MLNSALQRVANPTSLTPRYLRMPRNDVVTGFVSAHHAHGANFPPDPCPERPNRCEFSLSASG